MVLIALMKIDGITSPNADGKPAQATIEIESFSWGASVAVNNGSGSGAGRSGRGTLTVTKYSDVTSPQFFAAATSGKTLHNAILSLLPAVQDNANQPFLKYEFNEVLISSMEFIGNRGGASLPLESISFEYSKASIVEP